MPIWSREFTLEVLNGFSEGTILEHLEIVFTEIGPDFVKATMPVHEKTFQIAGLLHGGASVVLAETLGSVASYMCIDQEHFTCVGIEVNANHVRSVNSGLVTGIARPLHLGRSTHVWETKIFDDREKLISVGRLTVAVIPIKG
ncbi:MAG: hotdog fold thioesterase [Candidatus Hydrogenedentes bacterium]|nr:hotdog fold thioesterase [Candidatus Hydrogenedentota bacterium]